MLSISAGIPCFNNSETLGRVIKSISAQTHRGLSITVFDDASRDSSVQVAKEAGGKVSVFGSNSGRGAVRASMLEQCATDLLLSCDATNALDPDFLESALPWFEDESVAIVFGQLRDPNPRGVAGRWRARHLFLQGSRKAPLIDASLCTGSFVGKTKLIQQVGGFRKDLRHSEDRELGTRLQAAGLKVVFEPKCQASPLIENSLIQCLERHWRWYVAQDGMTISSLRSWIGVAWKFMLAKDLRANDLMACAVTIILPFHHYARCWFKSPQAQAPAKT